MVTDSRAYPERNGPPDPKTPENGSALLSSTTSFSMAAAPTIPSPLGIQKPPAIRPPWATYLIGCDNPMVIRSIRQLIVIKNVSKHIHKSDRFSWGKHSIIINVYTYIYIRMYNIYIYAQRLGFAQALQRRGFPVPNTCWCNFTKPCGKNNKGTRGY